jgi:hypothetical protein
VLRAFVLSILITPTIEVASMIFRFLRLLLLFVLIAAGEAAFGHGFQLSLTGNKLVGTGDDFLDGKTTATNTYTSNWTALTAGSLYVKGAGGVQPSDSGGLSVASGDKFSLEFLGPLMFSSGGSAVPAAAGVSLVANSYVNTTYTAPNLIDSATLDGSLTLPDLLDVSGNTSHSIQYVLSAATVPAGVYGFSFRVQGHNDATGAAYLPSDPLVVLLNTSDFTDPATVTAARAAVLSAVPEPSGVVIGAIGFAAAIVWRRANFAAGSVRR